MRTNKQTERAMKALKANAYNVLWLVAGLHFAGGGGCQFWQLHIFVDYFQGIGFCDRHRRDGYPRNLRPAVLAWLLLHNCKCKKRVVGPDRTNFSISSMCGNTKLIGEDSNTLSICPSIETFTVKRKTPCRGSKWQVVATKSRTALISDRPTLIVTYAYCLLQCTKEKLLPFLVYPG